MIDMTHSKGQLCKEFDKTLLAALRLLYPDGDFSELAKWLSVHGFYECPSSTRFHEAYEGGLLEHSCRVLNAAHELAQSPAFERYFQTEEQKAEMTVAALLHDICKCDRYESYVDKTGKTCYKYADGKPSPFGHGATSAILVQKFIPNVSEQILCAIRWHMGAWDMTSTDGAELGQANKYYPLVHLIQFADQISITNWWD